MSVDPDVVLEDGNAVEVMDPPGAPSHVLHPAPEKVKVAKDPTKVLIDKGVKALSLAATGPKRIAP